MRVAKLSVGFLIVLGAVAIGVPSSFAGAAHTTPGTPAVSASYLALGDSMAAGFQPNKGETKGYVGRVWRRFQQDIPGLRLRNVSCIGETTGSLITGRHSPCHYAAGSQLDAAVALLDAHPGAVAFITINVGSNDLVNRCLDQHTGMIDRACVADQRPWLKSRLTRILDALGGAAPGVPIVGMTYHDPFLGFWDLVPGGHRLARVDQRAWSVFNAGLASAYGTAGVAVADVATTFRIDDFTHTVLVPGRGRMPVNVALACEWTWFCSSRFQFDPHPNPTGYRQVARTFAREIRALLP